MKDSNHILEWPQGRGWIILSGGHVSGSPIRTQVLQRVNREGPVVYLGQGNASDETLDDLEDLGAPTGFHVDLVSEDDESILEQVKSASLVVIDETYDSESMKHSLMGAALEGILEAYRMGAIVFLEGQNASLLGSVFLNESGILIDGLSWLENTLVMVNSDVAQPVNAQSVLQVRRDLRALEITYGSALALGPYNQIELWGNAQVKITLGQDYLA